MKSLKGILKIAAIAIMALLVTCILYIASSGPALPEHTDEIIETVIRNPRPEIIKGKTGFAKSKGVSIWYESIAPEGNIKGSILLIMGISNDALGWPPDFIQAFVDSGYQVIRYDHRGTGMSDWIQDWDKKKQYSLTDMAADGIAVLDTLGIRKTTIIGISMGGMIAQELAIRYPKRVASLVSMMSSGFIQDPALPPISSAVTFELIKTSIKYSIIPTEKNTIKLHLASRMILMGNASYELNIRGIAQQVLYNLRKRKGYNSGASAQHQAAVFLSGSRYEQLAKLSVSTLIIHGKSDPFIPIEHGKKCAATIPHADSLWVEEMGHDLPDNLLGLLTEAIMKTMR